MPEPYIVDISPRFAPGDIVSRGLPASRGREVFLIRSYRSPLTGEYTATLLGVHARRTGKARWRLNAADAGEVHIPAASRTLEGLELHKGPRPPTYLVREVMQGIDPLIPPPRLRRRSLIRDAAGAELVVIGVQAIGAVAVSPRGIVHVDPENFREFTVIGHADKAMWRAAVTRFRQFRREFRKGRVRKLPPNVLDYTAEEYKAYRKATHGF